MRGTSEQPATSPESPLPTAAVERRRGLGREEFFAEYVQPRRPVVLTDAIDHWPALGSWTPENLGERFAGRTITNHGEPYDLGEYLRETQNPDRADRRYLKNVDIRVELPELLADIEGLPEYVQSNYLTSRLLPKPIRQREPTMEFFASGAHTEIALHFDEFYIHNFICQVYGKKDFVFFAPEDSPFLAPDPEYRYISRIADPFKADLAEFPELRRARPIRFTLSKGEAVLVPAGWWHKTWSHEASISVGLHFVNRSNWRDYVRDLTRSGLRPDNWKWRVLGGYLRAVSPLLRLRG